MKNQYHLHPYPPIPLIFLPEHGEGEALSYEKGARIAREAGWDIPLSHREIRVLVAGCGTFEPLIAAQKHPLAREIVAVDFSQSSIDVLKNRIKLHRAREKIFYPHKKQPARIRTVCADLNTWQEGEFDLILVSNVVHHTADPKKLLMRLSNWLRPGGLMRIVTYPKQSRIWMRETSRWLKNQGLSAQTRALVSKCKNAIDALPETHPVRNCYESQPETKTLAGLLDAFFHPCEVPLSPYEWQNACVDAKLTFLGDWQHHSSRGSFLTEIVPQTRRLDDWDRLQVMDDLLEICTNMVFWFLKPNQAIAQPLKKDFLSLPAPNSKELELGLGLLRAQRILKKAGIDLSIVLEALKKEVGPRTTAPPQQKRLHGLSITEYDSEGLLRTALVRSGTST